VGLESEVSSVKERDRRFLDVAPESLRARWQEERIAIAPDSQQRRLPLTKVLLELRIHVDIARVVEE
jgi:hypothetical protein